VVEDDAAVQRIAVRSLQKAGHQVLAAPDAKTALTLLNEQTFDVIVCDLALPGLSGPDFIERVRATRATCASHATQHTSSHALAEFTTRVLFVSGYSAELARTGEDSFLPKPYTPEALRQRVLELLAPLPQIATGSSVPRALVSAAGEQTQPQHDEV
jgi:CheY-like chemotaxis protein